VAGVTAVTELAGFPYTSHRAMRTAVVYGDGGLAVEYQGAREALTATGARSVLVMIDLLAWLPFLAAAASPVLAFASGDWLVLAGLPAALLGVFFGSPYVPLHALLTRVAIVAFPIVIISGNLPAGYRWIATCFLGALTVVWFLRWFACWRARAVILSSEAVTAYLFGSRMLHIRDATGRYHTAPSN